MTTIKQPTPEEINEAAENYAHGRVFPPQKVEYSYSLLSIMKRQKEAAKDDFLAAISWLQNYQTQQSDTLMPKCKSCGNVLIGIYETDKGICEKCVNSKQQCSVKSAEEILENMVDIMPYSLNEHIRPYVLEAMHLEKASDLYAEGVWINLSPNNPIRDMIYNAAKSDFEAGAKWQSSQPQPNAISVIEDYKEDLDKELRGSPSIQFVRDYQVKSQIINDLLTKLKP